MKFTGLFSSPPRPEAQTAALLAEVAELRSRSPLFDDSAESSLAFFIMEELGRVYDATLGMRIGAPMYGLIRILLQAEPFAYEPPSSHDAERLSLSEGVELRDRLRTAAKLLRTGNRCTDTWRAALQGILADLYREFPPQAFVDPDEQGNFEEFSTLAPTAPLYTFIADVPHLLQRIIVAVHAPELEDAGLFAELREQLTVCICLASGIRPEHRDSTEKQFVLPLEKKDVSPGDLVEMYLAGTPFYDLLTTPVPLQIPEAVRFEHTHIVAGTGHGKTQALQFLIAADLERAMEEKRSIVVMDSQGDLLQTLMHSDYFRSAALADRFVYVDPTDMERPVGLNLFDIGLGELNAVTPVERETILNGTIELYDYFFGGLLGAELTQKQGVVFRYLATLMTQIPDANIHTLRQLMEDGDPFRPYMTRLQGTSRAFFETRFFDRQFSETKKQILNRLWGVLSSASLDRMMGAKKNSVDLFNSLQGGSVVFINTAKDFLGQEGSAIYSRMFVALLGQALTRRASVPKHERTPTYIYIDEAQEIVDEKLIRMLEQVRKYKGAITFAHQNLDQLEPGIRAGVIANTSIKLAGGLSAKDARALAGDFRCDDDYLLSQRKTKHETHFACFAKNVTEGAVTLTIPLGYVEGREQLTGSQYAALVDGSRTRYGVPYEPLVLDAAGPDLPAAPQQEPEAPRRKTAIVPPPPAAEPTNASTWILDVPTPEPERPRAEIVVTREPASACPAPRRDMGGGGVKHKYLEHLIKELGEERGFRVTLEEPVLDGSGRVDAVLIRGEVQLAVEISVTTTRDHELGNIEKCLALPYTHIVMLASHKRHQTSLERFISAALEDKDKRRVSFLLPEDLPGFLDGYPISQAPTERTVKGYTVRSRVKEVDPAEAAARRRAIAQVVARSMQEA